MRGAGVGADRLYADPDDRCLARQPLGTLGREARGVRACVVGVEKAVLVRRACVPAGAADQPAALGQGAVLGFPSLDVIDLHEEVGVLGDLRREVEHRGRGDQLHQRYLGDVGFIPAAHPANTRRARGRRSG